MLSVRDARRQNEGMSAVPTPRSGRFAALAGGVGISVLAAYITLQERHDVNARRVESYSTLPVLLLFVGLGVLLAALATTSPRRTRIGLAALLIWSSCAATTRALWDTSLPHSTPPIQSSPTASPPTIPAIRLAAAPTSSKTEACVSSQLAAIAYTGGLATGTEYFFVAITNHSSRPCSTGERFDLMTGTTNETTTLASIKSSQTFGKPINVLAPNTRGIAAVTTTWAAELPGDADCPDDGRSSRCLAPRRRVGPREQRGSIHGRRAHR